MTDERRPSKQHDYHERPEYEESWRLEETWRHSNSRERLSANVDGKSSKGVNNNNNGTIKVLGEFYMETDHLIPARKTDKF